MLVLIAIYLFLKKRLNLASFCCVSSIDIAAMLASVISREMKHSLPPPPLFLFVLLALFLYIADCICFFWLIKILKERP
jgi:4-hydroxybenzoate polyprenyltransferase